MCVFLSDACEGRTHAHHAVYRSQGGKDDVAIPLCARHHMQLHAACGVFKGWTRLERFAWAMKAIAETRAAFEASRAA